MSSGRSLSSDYTDRPVLTSDKVTKSQDEICEEGRYSVKPLIDSCHTETSSSSIPSHSDNSDSVATVFRLQEERRKKSKISENVKPTFKIGGELSSRNGTQKEDNSHYIFTSKNCEHIKGNQDSYKSLHEAIPPINLTDCLPHSEISTDPIPSPTAISVSSLTSNRKLEWDSGADLGYIRKYEQSTSLSTLERMVLGNSASFLSLKDASQPIKKSQKYKQSVETDDTYCDTSDGKVNIPRRRIQMKQRYTKSHVTSPKRKSKNLEQGRANVKQLGPKYLVAEDSTRQTRPMRHFGGCCQYNKDAGKMAKELYAHSTPLSSSVSSETLKAEEYNIPLSKGNFPSFESTLSSNISQLSYDRSKNLSRTSDSTDDSRLSTYLGKSKSASRGSSLDETLSTINSSLKDLSRKLKIQADHLASHYKFKNENYQQVCRWIELIGMPAVDGNDVLFKQTLAEKVIKALTKISQKEVLSTSKPCNEVSSASVVLEDIGHLSSKLGHTNKDSFYKEIKERCTTPGGTVICVPYRPPASTKTYYITVNEDLLFIQDNELSKSKSPRCLDRMMQNTTNQKQRINDECLMMIKQISAEDIFSGTKVDISSDQYMNLQKESLPLEMTSEMDQVSMLFPNTSSSSNESESIRRQQSMQETVASSFEFYSASSTDTNLPTIDEWSKAGSVKREAEAVIITEEKQKCLSRGYKNNPDTFKDDLQKDTFRKKKKKILYEKSLMKCIKVLERIEKKLQLSDHPSFSDNSKVRIQSHHNTGNNKINSSDSSTDMCCTATTSSRQTTDSEGTFIRHQTPSEAENSLRSAKSHVPEVQSDTSSVRGSGRNQLTTTDISNLKKLLASTKLPGETRAHRFLLKDNNPAVGNFATAVSAESQDNSSINITERDSCHKRVFSTIGVSESNCSAGENSSIDTVPSAVSSKVLSDELEIKKLLDGFISSDSSSIPSRRNIGTKSKYQSSDLSEFSDHVSATKTESSYSSNRINLSEVDSPLTENITVSKANLIDSRMHDSETATISKHQELAVIEENLKKLRLRCTNINLPNRCTNISLPKSKLKLPHRANTKIDYPATFKESKFQKENVVGYIASHGRESSVTASRQMGMNKFNMATDLRQMNKENGLTLKEALYLAKPSYVIAADYRRAKILRKSKLRQELQSHNHSVLARLPESLKTPSTLQGFLVKNEESPVMQYSEMRAQNRRLVQLLPEINIKAAVNKKNATSVTNRLMGNLYSRKLRRKVLCGRVSHGHKNVVSPISQ